MVDDHNQDAPESGRSSSLSRRGFLRGSLAVGASVAGMGLLDACAGGSSDGGSSGKAAIPQAKSVPSYYPSSYDSIVAGSRKEKQLTIYSNLDESNWAPLISAFKKRYPWVSNVATNNLGSSEVFQRYYSEQARGSSAADMLVSGSPQDWIDLVQNRKLALTYDSPEKSKMPASLVEPLPGLYTFSTDPILMGYNTALVDKSKRPTGIGSLAKIVQNNPDQFKNKVTTYNISESFGFAVNYHYAQGTGNAWKKLDTILPFVRPEDSSGPMVDKMNSGEYLVGYFLSSTVVLPAAEEKGAIIGWSYIDDGTPLFIRGVAITKQPKHPNTAKLMLDFILSEAGQTAIYNGGLTPYRQNLPGDVKRSYQSILNEVGKDNIVYVDYKTKLAKSDIQRFSQRWNKALGQ